MFAEKTRDGFEQRHDMIIYIHDIYVYVLTGFLWLLRWEQAIG
jgi:hypothetical protein